jgi:competence protein ComGC
VTAKFKNQNGNTLVELVMVMMLLILFCVTMYSIIYAGSEAQTKITAQKDRQTDARVALAYIGNKLRQNDQTGKISIEKNPVNGENAIVLRYRTEEEYYDMWIYQDGDTLYEFIGLADEPPDVTLSIAIVTIEGMNIEIAYDQAANSVKSTLTYPYGKTEKTLSSLTHLRAAQW